MTGRLFVFGLGYTAVTLAADLLDGDPYLREVERVLEEHPGVSEAVVVGVPSPYGDERVKAVIVPAGPCAATVGTNSASSRATNGRTSEV